MQIEPAEQAFAERYAAGEAQVVWTTLVAVLETPVSAFLTADGRRPIRLSRLRHGAADGGASSAEAGPDRHSRRNPHPPGPGHRVRYGGGHAHHRRAGAAGARNPREARA